jgi:hypothetical protein
VFGGGGEEKEERGRERKTESEEREERERSGELGEVKHRVMFVRGIVGSCGVVGRCMLQRAHRTLFEPYEPGPRTGVIWLAVGYTPGND